MRLIRAHLLFIALLLLLVTVLSLSSVADELPDWTEDDLITDPGPWTYTGRTGYVRGDLIIGQNSQLTLIDSTLVVNHSVVVGNFGTLKLRNSTIKLDCSIDWQNRVDVTDFGTLEMVDKDDDPSTTGDRSVFMSNNSVNYNFTAFKNATIKLKDSAILQCGRYHDDPILEEGLVLRADGAVLSGMTVADGYYGIIMDQAADASLDNCTITDCTIGMMIIGNVNAALTNCTFSSNSQIGLQVRGFQRNLIMSDCNFTGSTQTHLHLVYSIGISNEITGCSIGPGGQNGIIADEIDGYTFINNNITGCDVGFTLDTSKATVETVRISDCTEGLLAVDGGTPDLVDIHLLRTTLTVEPGVLTNVTSIGAVGWEDSTVDLGCKMLVEQDSTLDMDQVTLRFRDTRGEMTGLETSVRSTLNISRSTLESPGSGRWYCHLKEASTINMGTVVLSDLGDVTGDARDLGLFVAASGTVESVTITDSVAGLVLGKSLARITNVSIQDCGTGIYIDGLLGRGGNSLTGVTISGCDAAVRCLNDGSLSINQGRLVLAGEGLNITGGSDATLRDSVMGDPGTGEASAYLEGTSSLNIVNSSTSRVFLMGPGDNTVNIYWYLNLTLKYLSDGSPLSDALVTVRELIGAPVLRDIDAGPSGVLEKLELRELVFNPEPVDTTPHTIIVRKGDLEDYFEITMDGSKDHAFELDNYPPELTVTSPTSGRVFNVSTMTFEGEAWDAVVTEHEGLETLRYRVDNGSWHPIDLPTVKAWTFQVTLEDGFHVLEVEVVDKIGNRAAATVTLEVDTTPPPLTILVPPDPAQVILTNKDTLRIVGRSDPGAEVRIDGSPVAMSGSGDFNHTVGLVGGENLITIESIDGLGNRATLVLTVFLDIVPPLVTFDHPGEWRTNSSRVNISGTKEVNTTIFIDEELGEFFGASRFYVWVDLVEGPNTFAVSSTDMADNTWSDTLLIHLDSTPPVLTVKALPEYTRAASIVIEGSVDERPATVTVNGRPVSLVGDSFTHQVTLSEGENTFTVAAVDGVGNAAETVTVSVTLDTQAPQLTITTAKFVKTKKDRLSLEGETEEGLTVKVRVEYGAYQRTYDLVSGADGSFEVEILLPQVGNHTLTVTVEDPAGNKATERLNFLRERIVDNGGNGDGDGDSWLSENWAWVVLGASIVASALVLIVAIMPRKRRSTPRSIEELDDEDESEEEEGEHEDAEDMDEEKGSEEEGDREEDERD